MSLPAISADFLSALRGSGSSVLPSVHNISAPSKTGIGDTFANFVADANRQQLESESAIQQLTSGQSSDLQNIVVSMAKADLSFRLAMEIRNRLIDAYQEIMRMQV